MTQWKFPSTIYKPDPSVTIFISLSGNFRVNIRRLSRKKYLLNMAKEYLIGSIERHTREILRAVPVLNL